MFLQKVRGKSTRSWISGSLSPSHQLDMSPGNLTEAPPPLITLNIVSSEIFCIAAQSVYSCGLVAKLPCGRAVAIVRLCHGTSAIGGVVVLGASGPRRHSGEGEIAAIPSWAITIFVGRISFPLAAVIESC